MPEKAKNQAVRNYTVYAAIGTIVELTLMIIVLVLLLPAFGINPGISGTAIIIAIMLSFSAFTYFMGRRALGQKYMHDPESIIGAEGKVLEAFDHKGYVKIGNEYWRAVSENPLKAGTEVTVISVDGLRINVAPKPGNEISGPGATNK